MFTSDVYQSWILGKIVFNIFINDMDAEFECILKIFADDTKQRVGFLGRDKMTGRVI